METVIPSERKYLICPEKKAFFQQWLPKIKSTVRSQTELALDDNKGANDQFFACLKPNKVNAIPFPDVKLFAKWRDEYGEIYFMAIVFFRFSVIVERFFLPMWAELHAYSKIYEAFFNFEYLILAFLDDPFHTLELDFPITRRVFNFQRDLSSNFVHLVNYYLTQIKISFDIATYLQTNVANLSQLVQRPLIVEVFNHLPFLKTCIDLIDVLVSPLPAQLQNLLKITGIELKNFITFIVRQPDLCVPMTNVFALRKLGSEIANISNTYNARSLAEYHTFLSLINQLFVTIESDQPLFPEYLDFQFHQTLASHHASSIIKMSLKNLVLFTRLWKYCFSESYKELHAVVCQMHEVLINVMNFHYSLFPIPTGYILFKKHFLKPLGFLEKDLERLDVSLRPLLNFYKCGNLLVDDLEDLNQRALYFLRLYGALVYFAESYPHLGLPRPPNSRQNDAFGQYPLPVVCSSVDFIDTHVLLIQLLAAKVQTTVSRLCFSLLKNRLLLAPSSEKQNKFLAAVKALRVNASSTNALSVWNMWMNDSTKPEKLYPLWDAFVAAFEFHAFLTNKSPYTRQLELSSHYQVSKSVVVHLSQDLYENSNVKHMLVINIKRLLEFCFAISTDCPFSIKNVECHSIVELEFIVKRLQVFLQAHSF